MRGWVYPVSLPHTMGHLMSGDYAPPKLECHGDSGQSVELPPRHSEVNGTSIAEYPQRYPKYASLAEYGKSNPKYPWCVAWPLLDVAHSSRLGLARVSEIS